MFCKGIKMNRKQRREKILKAYNYWQENLEVRLAGVKAAKEKLEEQIDRDNQTETIE